MKRRNLLRYLGMSAIGAALPMEACRVWASTSSTFKGLFYVNIHATGGWDVTSFCDPKINQPNEKIINNWAANAEMQKAGNISFAPVGNNAVFFKQHYEKMLVINGLNCRTNAHVTGHLYNSSGSQKNAAPYLSALYANTQNSGLAMPMPYMVLGDVNTANLIVPTKLSRDTLQIIDPNIRSLGQSAQWLPNDDLEAINQLQTERAQTLKDNRLQLAKQRQHTNEYYDAVFANSDGFKNFAPLHGTVSEGEYVKNNTTDAIKVALTAFTTGIGISADISVGGFDTHDNHDSRAIKALDDLTNSVGALWHFAEQLGIADRLVVSIASDFGRTPFYNEGNGKDHWIYGSAILMQKNVAWTNRVIGKTTEFHKALKINPQTLQVDPNGVELEPAHIHQNLRNYFGISNASAAQQFKLEAATPIDILTSGKQTA